MNTSKTVSKSLEASTTQPAKSSGNTDTKNSSKPRNTGWLSRSEANKILDRSREGVMTPSHLINESLKATGDLT